MVRIVGPHQKIERTTYGTQNKGVMIEKRPYTIMQLKKETCVKWLLLSLGWEVNLEGRSKNPEMHWNPGKQTGTQKDKPVPASLCYASHFCGLGTLQKKLVSFYHRASQPHKPGLREPESKHYRVWQSCEPGCSCSIPKMYTLRASKSCMSCPSASGSMLIFSTSVWKISCPA